MSLDVSVVIPTYNRAAHLRRVLRALSEQDLDRTRFEVVVVDDGSRDATPDVLKEAREYPLTALRQENQGPAAARNAAIGVAAGRVVVFIDDDVVPAPSVLSTHLDANAPGAAATVAIGPMVPPPGGDRRQPVWAAWELRMLEKQYGAMASGLWAPTPRQFYTGNASVPRDALLRAGLFDPSFTRAEDVELAYRLEDLGLRFRFLPDAPVVHDTPRSLAAWLRLGADYGHYDVVLCRERGRAHRLESMVEECVSDRRPAMRAVARVVAGRPALMCAVRVGGPLAIRAADAVRLRRLALAGCSAVFNLQYWDAVCRELGRDAWWSAVDSASRRAAGLAA